MKAIYSGNDLCRIIVSDGYDELIKNLYEFVKIDKKYDKVIIITDDNVKDNLYEEFSKSLSEVLDSRDFQEICIKNGEESKCIKTFEEVISKFIDVGVSRKSLVIAFGGGVVGDLAGFVAATYMRGIDYIQLPTTLLSQVDSSIGGKTGIDVGIYKNMIGAFKQPIFTYINIKTLNTLPKSEIKSGFGEVLKYAAIMDDDRKFEKFLLDNSKCIKNMDSEMIFKIILKCAEFKASIVKADEKEGGLRKILNFGHTFGHAIEMEYGLKHGEAVAIGIKIAFNVAFKMGYIEKSYYEDFIKLVDEYGFKFDFSKLNLENMLEVIKKDKKNSFGEISLILPDEKSCVGIFKLNYDEVKNVLKKEFNLCSMKNV